MRKGYLLCSISEGISDKCEVELTRLTSWEPPQHEDQAEGEQNLERLGYSSVPNVGHLITDAGGQIGER
jgi:hypothetical protein